MGSASLDPALSRWWSVGRMLPGPTCARLMNCCDQLLLDGRFADASNFSHFDSPKYNRLPRAAALLRGTARRPVLDLTTVCLT